VTYEPPAVEARAEVGGPLIGLTGGSPGAFASPAWRRPDDREEETP
jgi:hypothetical protein